MICHQRSAANHLRIDHLDWTSTQAGTSSPLMATKWRTTKQEESATQATQHKPEPGQAARDGACRVESVTSPVLPHHRKAERKTGKDGDETTRVNQMGFKPAGLASSYFVKVYMGGKERLMLLDSGCTHSVMPVELFDELDEEAKMTVVVQGGSGRLADGAMIASHGKMTADMKTRAAAKTTKLVPVRQKFILAEVNGEPVLGMDFFHNNKCKLDFVNYNAWVNDAAVTCYNQEGKPSFQRVHLVRKITIPGRTEMCVEGPLKMDPAHSLGVVKSDWKTAGLLTAATLHEVHDMKLVVRVTIPLTTCY